MGLFNKKELKRIEELKQELEELKKLQKDLGITEYAEAKKRIESEEKESLSKIEKNEKEAIDRIEALQKEAEAKAVNANMRASKLYDEITRLENRNEELNLQNDKLTKNVESSKRKLEKAKNLYQTYDHSIKAYNNSEYPDGVEISEQAKSAAEELCPTITLQLNCLNVQELRKAYRENEKLIRSTLDAYKGRYTTKANQAIYSLMVIALQAELQNILYSMKYDKLEKALQAVTDVCEKYLAIAAEGNQSIAGTIKKFIGEIEALFTNAVKIEYEYYVKKERERAEQAAIREQMRQEAEERRILEQQKKQVEKEESKYLTEMENVKAQLENTEDLEKINQLNKKILELQDKLSKVEEQKEEIVNRQNGKAGNVYIISNLGSFGDNVFKVGMTRRLEPMDRIHELGSASVPFEFDVHAMIFSEDAVSLENKLHKILDDHRVNKINLRKEFFKVDLDEMEKIVLQEDPAAEFNRTMLAEEYRQTLSLEEEKI